MAKALQNNTEWWRGGTIYQIYPRSFQDSTGNGCGDLPGITRRLDYVAELGVDAIWISPFFTSPMNDFGYDVSDYRSVDSLFGTLADFEELVAKASQLNLKVIIDLVISHTSKQHPWFMESSSSKDNPQSDWYVWADARPDGTVPNNWLSVFGGSAWQWHTSRCQYYLHNFLASQPDLNFHQPAVQEGLLDTARFWLDKGVCGFRLDTVNFYFHDQQLRNNPALDSQTRSSDITSLVNPYSYQDHIYARNRPENLAFLEKLRALTDEYPGSTLLGEVGDAVRGLEIVGSYTQNRRLHMCYSFELLAPDSLTPAKIRKLITEFTTSAPDGWPCWALSNHDVPRHISRLAANGVACEPQGKMLLAMLLALRGSVCLYQGEELGLPEAEIAFEDLQDPYGIEFWPEFKGRDGCRTPMAWESGSANLGFSDARPWLPCGTSHASLAASEQEARPASMLHHYRKLLTLRRSEPALQTGAIELVDENTDDTLCFWRTDTERRILCCFNFSERPTRVSITDQGLEMFATGEPPAVLDEQEISLPPYGYCWARK